MLRADPPPAAEVTSSLSVENQGLIRNFHEVNLLLREERVKAKAKAAAVKKKTKAQREAAEKAATPEPQLEAVNMAVDDSSDDGHR